MPAFVIAIAAVVTVLTGGWVLQSRARVHVAVASFWFDEAPFTIDGFVPARGGGPVTPDEMALVQRVAWTELRGAYAGLRVRFVAAPDTMYRIRVMQSLPLPPWSPFRRGFAAAGESRAVRPIGGRGAVSFSVIANNALAYAPPEATRGQVLEGIGRGLGRVAAHEFAHQFLPTLDIHASRDRGSYEYWSAGRREQYYEPLHWDIAWPRLVERLGRAELSGAATP